MTMRSIAYRLTLLLVFVVPWEAAIQIGGFGRASKLVGVAAAVVWLLSVVARGGLRRLEPFHKLLFLFLIWSGTTLLWSVDTASTSFGFLTYVQLFALTLLLWDLFSSREAIHAALQAYVLGAYVACGSILSNYVTAPPARFPEHERVNALGFQVDGIALIVAIAAPAAWYLAMGPGASERRPAVRALYYAYLPAGIFALVLTGTRGAALASVPTIALVLWSLWRARTAARVTALAAVLAGVVLVVGFAPRGQLARIETAATASQLGDEGGALSTRWAIWQQSVRVFFDHPIAGVGVDGHRAAVAPRIGQQTIYKKDAREAHNTYLSILTETGMVGFGLLAAVLACIALSLRMLSGWDAWYWSAQVGVLAIGALSLSLEDSKSLWIFLSLCVSSAAIARTGETGPAREPAAAAPRIRGSASNRDTVRSDVGRVLVPGSHHGGAG